MEYLLQLCERLNCYRKSNIRMSLYEESNLPELMRVAREKSADQDVFRFPW